MRAIEFTAKIKNGVIQIPQKYRKLTNQLARIIILTDDKETDKPVQDFDAIQAILARIQTKNTFLEINDPVAWQRSVRDEWNERID